MIDSVMKELEVLGNEQRRQIFKNHGSKEPLYGVKVADLKKLVKTIKNDNGIVKELYATGNYDAMYLAGLSVNIKELSREEIEEWMLEANCYMLSEYAVASVAAESLYAVELAKKWIEQEEELMRSGGWSTYSNYISIAKDEMIDKDEVRLLLNQIKQTIHNQANRVKYTMNGFVIAVGAYVPELSQEALEVAEVIGKVSVSMGKTACKVPNAVEQINKVIESGRCGKKRKSCRC